MPENATQAHNLCIEDRSRMRLTGVEDVDCFSENIAVITTTMGAITVTGASLKVSRLDLQSGEVSLEGQIDSVEYGAVRKGGFLSRVFR